MWQKCGNPTSICWSELKQSSIFKQFQLAYRIHRHGYTRIFQIIKPVNYWSIKDNVMKNSDNHYTFRTSLAEACNDVRDRSDSEIWLSTAFPHDTGRCCYIHWYISLEIAREGACSSTNVNQGFSLNYAIIYRLLLKHGGLFCLVSRILSLYRHYIRFENQT